MYMHITLSPKLICIYIYMYIYIYIYRERESERGLNEVTIIPFGYYYWVGAEPNGKPTRPWTSHKDGGQNDV